MEMKGQAERPNLLLICHCFPDALGNTGRSRAWQLLRLASRWHRVHVACLWDGPVNLSQWRDVNLLAERIALEPVSLRQRAVGRSVGAVNGPEGDAARWRHSLEGLIEGLCQRARFDVVICTHPALWEQAMCVDARKRVCDLHVPRSLLMRRRAELHSGLWGAWYRRQARLYDRMERSLADRCDILTLSRRYRGTRFPGDRGRMVLLPHTIDLSRFELAVPPEPPEEAGGGMGDGRVPPPRLVVHADWSHRPARWALGRFTRRVWPEVKRAVPEAQLCHTDAASPPEALHTLQEASVVVSTVADPDTARVPILQAMAMRRAVIAPLSAADQLGARHGEHLLLTRSVDEWAQLCIQSLRSASMRLELSRGAREFVERYCPFEESADEFVRAIQQPGRFTPAIARAA